MKKLYSLGLLVLIAGFAMGQKKYIRCFSDELLQEEIKKNPDRGKKLEAMNKKVDELIAGNAAQSGQRGKPGGTTPRTTTVYIPVVVNVVYNTPAQNISDNQIQSQIDVLNLDYSKTNLEITVPNKDFVGGIGIVANFKVQFCLYKVVRKSTLTTEFNGDAVKKTLMGGQDPTNAGTMLNIWVCNLGGSLLGYATFPGGAVGTDGAVILYSAFGTSAAGASAYPYDEGRTATHEIGHWLGLYHTFQGGCSKTNDGVKDTPPLKNPTFGCPGPNYASECGATIAQTMNYMDYVEDECMYMFTNGQLARVDGFIATSRAAYCLAVCPTPAASIVQQSRGVRLPTAGQKVTVFPTVTGSVATVSVSGASAGRGEILLLSQGGAVVSRQTVSVSKGGSNHSVSVGNLPNGMYTVKVTTPGGAVETRKIVVQH